MKRWLNLDYVLKELQRRLRDSRLSKAERDWMKGLYNRLLYHESTIDDAIWEAKQATLVVHHGTGKITSSRETVKERDRQFVKKNHFVTLPSLMTWSDGGMMILTKMRMRAKTNSIIKGAIIKFRSLFDFEGVNRYSVIKSYKNVKPFLSTCVLVCRTINNLGVI